MAEKGKNGNRDYVAERKAESPKRKADRAARNRAARKMDCPKGQSVEHVKPMRDGGTNAKSNLKCVSKKTNDGWRKGKKNYD